MKTFFFYFFVVVVVNGHLSLINFKTIEWNGGESFRKEHKRLTHTHIQHISLLVSILETKK
jgi:hypothetical protein